MTSTASAITAAPCVREVVEIMIATAAATTAVLTARPTPTAPPLTVMPKWQLVIAMASPNTTDLKRPFGRSHGFRLSAKVWKNVDSSMSSSACRRARRRRSRRRRRRRRGEERDHHRDHARHDEETDRVDGERAQAVELLGDGHGAELGGVVGADAAGEHQRDQDRPDLAQHRVAGAQAEQAVGAEASSRRCPSGCTMMPPVKNAVSTTMGTDWTPIL